MSRRGDTTGGASDDILIIGAGLGGLSAAAHLTGAGRRVRILEAGDGPGGLMADTTVDGYRWDLGPTVLTMPGLIDDALAALGESRQDWLDLVPLSPAYRASYADGTVLNSYSDPAAMTDEIGRVCGAAEARGFGELLAFLTRLYAVEFDTYMARNLDTIGDLLRPQALSLLAMGGLRSLERKIGRYVADDRVRRLFTFQALYAGVSPRQARAIYGVIAYLDSIAGVYFPRGGMHQVAAALAGAVVTHGGVIDYGTRVARVELHDNRATGVITEAGERIEADVVIVNSDIVAAYETLLPRSLRPWRVARPRLAPSAFVWHVGSAAPLPDPAHHSISFGAAWAQTFREIIDAGRLMSDPSLLVTNPTATDPSAAPAGHHTYYVLAPVPNLTHGTLDWARIGPRYRDEVARVLAERGFDVHGAFSTGVRAEQQSTPAGWAASGLSGGTPFALAHTLAQTGPLRHPTQHPAVPNLLFCGAGVQPGVGVPTVLLSGRLAASRVTG